MSGDSITIALWGLLRNMAYIGNEQEEPPESVESVSRLVYRHKLLSELQLDDLRQGYMSLNEGKRFEQPCKLLSLTSLECQTAIGTGYAW
jgi:hypothetical protein